MYIYSNGFRIAAKDNLKELIIDFLQTRPKIDLTNGNIVGEEAEIVSSIVLNEDTIILLQETLNKVVSDASKGNDFPIVD